MSSKRENEAAVITPSIEQLEEIAQYLSSKDTQTISSGPLDNNCSNLLEKSHLDYKASWPSWGF